MEDFSEGGWLANQSTTPSPLDPPLKDHHLSVNRVDMSSCSILEPINYKIWSKQDQLRTAFRGIKHLLYSSRIV